MVLQGLKFKYILPAISLSFVALQIFNAWITYERLISLYELSDTLFLVFRPIIFLHMPLWQILNRIGVIEGVPHTVGEIVLSGFIALLISLGIGIKVDNYRLNKLRGSLND
jgi:hypothetical protein